MQLDDGNLIPREQADDGRCEMIVVGAQIRKEPRVVMRFAHARLWVAFDLQAAVNMGKHMIDEAVNLGANVTIQLPRRTITREQRDRLVVRATNVFRNQVEKGKPPAEVARQVVDSILSAID